MRLSSQQAHEFILTPKVGDGTWEFSANFSEKTPTTASHFLLLTNVISRIGKAFGIAVAQSILKEVQMSVQKS
jgi:hypothetical protein